MSGGDPEQQRQKLEEYLRQIGESHDPTEFLNFMAGRAGGAMPEKFKQVLEHLNSGDEVRIMQAVMDLSTELSMMQETAISQHTLEQFVPPLINCLKMVAFPDIMRKFTDIIFC